MKVSQKSVTFPSGLAVCWRSAGGLTMGCGASRVAVHGDPLLPSSTRLGVSGMTTTSTKASRKEATHKGKSSLMKNVKFAEVTTYGDSTSASDVPLGASHKEGSVQEGRAQLDYLADKLASGSLAGLDMAGERKRLMAAAIFQDPGGGGYSSSRDFGTVRDSGTYAGKLMLTLQQSTRGAGMLDHLGDDDLRSAMRQFRKFDRDHDGVLSPAERRSLWQELSALPIFQALDAAGPGADADPAEAGPLLVSSSAKPQ